jgi:hypothetical protein
MSDLKEKCFNTIDELFKKYEDDEYTLQRIFTRVVNYLPNEIDNDIKKHEKNITRTTYLTNEQKSFIQIFLSKNQYYYLSTNSCFYNYNGKNYIIVKEDDIIYKLLSSISKDRVLLDWKHKTKKNVITLIKERNLFSSIPETYTIQRVLNTIYPSIFSSKTHAKYFLTIIGDNILKKNQNLIFLVSQKTKKLLSELDCISYLSIGITNTTNNFMTKYHENHTFTNCRLIKINDNFCIDMWKELLKKNGLDLLCVAVHYSNRNENSDIFIENKADEEFKNYSYYLKNITQKEIVDHFSINFLKQVNNDNKIGWKSIHFIWKQFLLSHNLPNMIYSNTLKNILKDKYIYEETTDSFINITSKYLPIESDFIKFWENTINTENTDIIFQDFCNELEIDEICSLFKNWVKNSSTNESFLSNGTISEENVINILKHFFPDIEIIEDKYALNVSCKMWDKNNDIEKSFQFIKNKIKVANTPLISIDETYNFYCKYNSIHSNKFNVSKRYFEKYLSAKIPEFIVDEKLIKTNWANTD